MRTPLTALYIASLLISPLGANAAGEKAIDFLDGDSLEHFQPASQDEWEALAP